jgi:hypothetical protein
MHHFFEVYTKGPDGQTGWDINVGFVLNTSSRREAVERIKRHFGEKFDLIIQCHESTLFEIFGPKTIIR